MPRRRGKSKTKNFRYDGEKVVIRLELDLTDTRMGHRVENHYEAAFQLRRALQRDARTRCRAYWADVNGRADGPKQVRERLGLSRRGIGTLAKEHVEGSKWMRHHLSKATALHIADEVWETIDRHLHPDASGSRHGAPRVGSWFDFTRIPGRARSRTIQTKTWETYRLAGSLQGYLDTFRPDSLDGLTVAEAVLLPAGTSVLDQPKTLPAPVRPAGRAGWWDHDGALTVVFTGLPKGDLILPVNLPQGAGQWPHLAHFLAEPQQWHKIDLVRVQDRHAPGGWRYYAHLLIHGPGYQSASTRARRALVPQDRIAGLDANVSNLTVLSHVGGSDVQTSAVAVTPEMLAAAHRDATKTRRRHKALDRSRRNSNAEQYELSKRQAKRAARRAKGGLPAKQAATPGGARVARTDGKPKRAYRKDELSRTYRRLRADHATDSRRVSQAKHARAVQVAADMIVQHGSTWIGEQIAVSNWSRLWGKRIALFSPGMLQAAIRVEAAAIGGSWSPAATRTTAMSQHCLCGTKVSKDLSVRTHEWASVA